MREQLKQLEAQAADKDLWQNQEQAQRILRDKSRLEQELNHFDELIKELDDIITLYELALEEDDSDTLKEVTHAVRALHDKAMQARMLHLMDGEADHHDCFLEVHAGSGGTEAQDWAQMLVRMYVRWAQARGFAVEWLEESASGEAGIKSATVRLNGDYAYGWLKRESGIHRLVRISPFDANARRHTSFASVKCYPVIEDDIEIALEEKDVRIDTYRASGAGGQHVNKTDSAVRLTHIPTGIVVQCQNDRSQHRNKAAAFTMLKARLYEQELAKRDEEKMKARSTEKNISWGNQIRSYVLHPYRMVKDLRTQHESGNADDVLNGNLDPFLKAQLNQPR